MSSLVRSPLTRPRWGLAAVEYRNQAKGYQALTLVKGSINSEDIGGQKQEETLAVFFADMMYSLK